MASLSTTYDAQAYSTEILFSITVKRTTAGVTVTVIKDSVE